MKPLTDILVPIDFGPPAASAFAYARAIASATGARLHLLHVAESLKERATTGPIPGLDLGRRQLELETDALQTLRALLDNQLRAAGTQTIVMTSNQPASAILRYAREARIDLIVMGTHGRSGIAEFFMGSVAQQVVRQAPCPVVTLRKLPEGAAEPTSAVPPVSAVV